MMAEIGTPVAIVELRRDARAVDSRSSEAGVGMGGTGGFVVLVVLCVVPDVALPVDAVLRRIVVEAFPPDGVVVGIERNVSEDGILLCCGESIGVGVLVCSGSDAEEAVFGVDCPEAAVLADPQPCDVIADAPHLVALLAEESPEE